MSFPHTLQGRILSAICEYLLGVFQHKFVKGVRIDGRESFPPSPPLVENRGRLLRIRRPGVGQIEVGGGGYPSRSQSYQGFSLVSRSNAALTPTGNAHAHAPARA